MKNKSYNLFIFFSMFVRNLIEVFSCVLLYNKGYSVNDILLFIIFISFIGIVVDYISLRINYKIVLIVSSIVYGFSYYYLSIINNSFINLFIFSILYSIGVYSYSVIRHLFGLLLLNNNKRSISIILIFNYLGVIISSMVGAMLIKRLLLSITSIIVIILSILSIVPIRKVDIKYNKLRINKVYIPINKVFFSIFEQFKVIFIILQPLYLYLYVNKSIYYIGIFNVIINIASLIVMYFISNRINNKYFKYLNIILCLSLILKLNFRSSIILLVIAFFEGIGQKIYEIISLENLYDNDGDVINYLMMEEVIFSLSRGIIILIFYIFVKDLITILYICIIGIFISGFYIC